MMPENFTGGLEGSRYVWPQFPTANLAYESLTYSKSLSQSPLPDTNGGPNLANAINGQFCHVVALTSANNFGFASRVMGVSAWDASRMRLGTMPDPSRNGSVHHIILKVFSWRGPTQIDRSIVRARSISVCGVMLWCRRRAMKRCAYKAMGDEAFKLSVNRKCHPKVSIRTDLLLKYQTIVSAAPIWNRALEAPKIRYGIIRRNRNCAPLLSSVIGISHIAVPSRVGQGWGGVTAPFQPVYSSCFFISGEVK